MSLYEIVILTSGQRREAEHRLSRKLESSIADFGLSIGKDVVILNEENLSQRNRKAPCVVAYFGSPEKEHIEELQTLISQKVPIIPIVDDAASIQECIPDLVKQLNAHFLDHDDENVSLLSAALLECVGLLRDQRRVFVSYRRTESRLAALQLHDLLTSKGFDVFLDTHDIRPGEPFQDVLWHRLVDSDVMVMLDTPTYFDSKWTVQELGRARAKEIHILRVVWPNHESHRAMSLSEAVYLAEEDLETSDGPIKDERVEEIAFAVENLRSRSIAARYLSIAGKLWEEAEKIGAEVQGVGAHRAISLRLLDQRLLRAYPVVGLPNAELLNDIADKSDATQEPGTPVLIYDHVGIREKWQQHLAWLDKNIRSVRTLKVREADWLLAGWEE
ncbi:hypothetical protein MSNKSG1_05798 [Marinobacter santoriniensis NKSG1]|uniref:TIR domain-containing protein n=1 Tax=Marinobacter santoriniensis NKSG1 TaxID=1288826 RepID=M7CTK0_9GAMM|nr:toll/interleukin-1 receptor domain-containing protein [Marinobacter santoriniensis]EMP56434.1 hypothetical protein MSNKSG1_05798 [Marinobacter santoriniensis NKSG1]